MKRKTNFKIIVKFWHENDVPKIWMQKYKWKIEHTHTNNMQKFQICMKIDWMWKQLKKKPQNKNEK